MGLVGDILGGFIGARFGGRGTATAAAQAETLLEAVRKAGPKAAAVEDASSDLAKAMGGLESAVAGQDKKTALQHLGRLENVAPNVKKAAQEFGTEALGVRQAAARDKLDKRWFFVLKRTHARELSSAEGAARELPSASDAVRVHVESVRQKMAVPGVNIKTDPDVAHSLEALKKRVEHVTGLAGGATGAFSNTLATMPSSRGGPLMWLSRWPAAAVVASTVVPPVYHGYSNMTERHHFVDVAQTQLSGDKPEAFTFGEPFVLLSNGKGKFGLGVHRAGGATDVLMSGNKKVIELVAALRQEDGGRALSELAENGALPPAAQKLFDSDFATDVKITFGSARTPAQPAVPNPAASAPTASADETGAPAPVRRPSAGAAKLQALTT